MNQSHLLDRIWLEQTYLPSLAGDILYVGVRYYTDFYHQLVKTPESFVTVDLDPLVEKFGSPHGHFVDTLENFLNQSGRIFDHISLFGLFGLKDSAVEGKADIINLLNPKSYGPHSRDQTTVKSI